MKKTFFLFLILFQGFLQAHEGTVVCIHGFITSARSMRPIEQSLKCIGFQVCSWNYETRRRFIEEHACDLVLYLQNIASHRPKQPIHFVTHSIGALVLRAALNHPQCPAEAKWGRAVLIAPPNQGSRLARQFQDFIPVCLFMGSKSGWQLLHYDSRDIQCLGSFPDSMKILVIAGTRGIKVGFSEPNDGLLTIDETVLETPYYWVGYPVTHGKLLVYRPVLCCLRTFLSGNFNKLKENNPNL